MSQPVTLMLTSIADDLLHSMAQESGKSQSEVAGEAIILKYTLLAGQKEGSKILVQRPDGSLKELIIT